MKRNRVKIAEEIASVRRTLNERQQERSDKSLALASQPADAGLHAELEQIDSELAQLERKIARLQAAGAEAAKAETAEAREARKVRLSEIPERVDALGEAMEAVAVRLIEGIEALALPLSEYQQSASSARR